MQDIKNKYSGTPKTILTIVTGFLLIAIYKNWDVLLKVAAIIGLIGVLSDKIAWYIEWLWFKLAWVLSKIVPNILLSILFFCLLFPLALLSRIFKKSDTLKLKNPEGSVFREINKKYDAAHFETLW